MNQKKGATAFIIFLLCTLFIFFFPRLGLLPFPFTYTIPVLIVLWLVLRRTKETFADLGFSFKRFEAKSILTGALAAVILFCFLHYGFFPLLKELVPLKAANLDDFKSIRQSPWNFAFIVTMGWLAGGFYEELVFHGFIFTRLEKLVTGKYSLIISVLITNLVFGLYHYQLGFSGVLNAFLAGLAYHFLMIRHKRNLWYSIFFHGFFDTIALTYIYLGYM